MIIADSQKFKKFFHGNQSLMILSILLRQLLIGKRKLNNTENIFNFF